MISAGFSDEQVEAITEYIDSGAATKDDIARLEGKIIALDGKLNLVQWIAGSSVAIGLANLYLILRILQTT